MATLKNYEGGNVNKAQDSKNKLYNKITFCALIEKKSFANDEKISILCKVGEHKGRAKVNVFKSDLMKLYPFEQGDVFEGSGEIYFRKIKNSTKYSVEFKLESVVWYKRAGGK